MNIQKSGLNNKNGMLARGFFSFCKEKKKWNKKHKKTPHNSNKNVFICVGKKTNKAELLACLGQKSLLFSPVID